MNICIISDFLQSSTHVFNIDVLLRQDSYVTALTLRIEVFLTLLNDCTALLLTIINDTVTESGDIVLYESLFCDPALDSRFLEHVK